MRNCKPSDVHALITILGALDEFSMELTLIRAKLLNLKSDVKKYMEEQKEKTSNVQTTHGLSADNG
jgi:hypothetical protein